MTNPERSVKTATRIRERVDAYTSRAVDVARSTAERAADRLQGAEAPVRTLADAARQLSALSHRSAGRMLDQGVTTVHGAIMDGAQRLRRAARADGVTSLYRQQLERLPASRDRVVKDVRASWGILADAGRELQTLALNTYAQLVGKEMTKTTRKTKTSRTTKTAKKKAKRRARRRAA